MYTIYADGELLYNPTLTHEGYGVVAPRLTVEVNKAGSLEYTVPPTNAKYDAVKKLKSIITAFQNDYEIFRGRVLHDEKDFYKQKKTYCEGELAFLLDSVQRPYTFSGKVADLFKKYINYHNSRVEANKRFVVGKVTVSGNITCENYNYPTTIDEITEQILNTVGGELVIRLENGVRYIDLIAESEEDGTVNYANQTIEFGTNLLDITEYITAENVFTVIVPLGGSLNDSDGNVSNEKLTITSVNDGKDYIENATAINLFGRIERRVEWTDVDDAATLKSLATKELSNNIKMAVSLTVTAVDLHLLNVNVDSIKVGNWVRVISIPHELDTYFKCTKIVYDFENPENNEYSFGVTTMSLTDQQVSDKKSMKNSVSMVLSTAGAVNASVNKANQANATFETIITQIPTDYVSTSTFEAYKTEVTEDLQSVQNDYEALLARVIELEGGTA